ncbi:hypothetical protein QR98_0094520 [Sarcoptes scabiei]|uniref:Uncharacterized protein n=1 Tax=Sarcoptes scabiei TaxID=52283 RepID=A0A132AIY7_SARSC|nr:hypothetical protein QR98_0094520 [Sarcoptes scabiei]
MYKKKFKQTKTSNSNRSITKENEKDLEKLVDKSITSPKINNEQSSLLLNTSRKHTSLPSFANISGSILLNTSKKIATENQNQDNDSKSNRLNLDDIDFEEDIILNDLIDTEIKSNLTDGDKNEMMRLVKKDFSSNSDSFNPIESKPNQTEESFSALLDDDFEFDDDDLEFDLNLNESTETTLKKTSHEEENEFRTASGTKIPKPKKSSYENILPLMFGIIKNPFDCDLLSLFLFLKLLIVKDSYLKIFFNINSINTDPIANSVY